MMLAHIVAVAENNVIGNANTLPWNLPEDMKFFREKTKGHAIIMGRKTYESMGKALPHRLNVVVSRQPDFVAPGCVIAANLEAAIDYCRAHSHEWGDEVFIIGGGEIYRQSMMLVDLVYLTRIHQNFAGDTVYPTVNSAQFEEVERRERTEPVSFTFLTYRRKK